MKISIEHLIEGAKKAEGLTVIIDVFRAFTVAAYIMNNGAKKIIPVGKLADAYQLKEKNPDYVLVGERKGLPPPGFDFGNSPHEIKKIDFTAKTVVMTTTAGVQGIVNAQQADEIILGSFVTIGATIEYIQKSQPAVLTLVAMGAAGVQIRDEDKLCAEHIKESLEGGKPDSQKIVNYLMGYKSAQKFFDEKKPEFHKQDFDCALELDALSFVLKVVKNNSGIEIIKI